MRGQETSSDVPKDTLGIVGRYRRHLCTEHARSADGRIARSLYNLYNLYKEKQI